MLESDFWRDNLMTDEQMKQFKEHNAELFVGDIYCGDNAKHSWLPFDYWECVDRNSDYQEFHYVRLHGDIDPERRIYDYCLFHIDDGLLEFGSLLYSYDGMTGEHDYETIALFELTLEGSESLPHLRCQYDEWKVKGL